MTTEMLRPLGAGAAFGAALTASRVYLPSVVKGQMRLEDFHMLEVFLTATGSSALVLLLLERLGFSKRKIRPNSTMNWWSKYDANILGGALIGLGMSLTGACPGTVIVQLAQGIRSARLTALGAIAGGMFYAKYGHLLRSKDVAAPSNTQQQQQPATLSTELGVKPQTAFLVFELCCAAIIGLSASTLPGKSLAQISTIISGLLIAAAQATSILLTSSPLGVSSAYEELGGLIWRFLGVKSSASNARIPKSIVFTLGMILGSWGLGAQLSLLPRAVPTEVIGPVEAVVGGCVMVVGARLAGGCTSGHGISGLAAMSFSSLLTVCAMFAGGILTEMIRIRL